MSQAKYIELASAMLLALIEDVGDDDSVNFPSLPASVHNAQHALFVQLHNDGYLIGDQSSLSYVEPCCVEHQIVHVHIIDNFEGQSTPTGWLIIDPTDGSVERL